METGTNNESEKWQQSVSRELSKIRREQEDQRHDIGSLQNWHITHMTECHPKILGRLALIFGVGVGMATALGFVLGNLFPWLAK